MQQNNITSTWDAITIYVEAPEEISIITPTTNNGSVSVFTISYIFIGIIAFCVLFCCVICLLCSCAQRSARQAIKQHPEIFTTEIELSDEISGVKGKVYGVCIHGMRP